MSRAAWLAKALSMRGVLCSCLVLCALGLAGPLHAQVTEPDGLAVPKPVGATEVGLVTGHQFPESAITLDGLFAFRGETLNYVTDARTAPAVFSPLCGFTATLVLRGGGCKLDFGWYNATQSGGTPPPDSEIYPLIERTDPLVYDCSYDGSFCPLAYNGALPPAGNKTWTLKEIPSGNIRDDTLGRYKGGLVGFALKGNAASCCQQTKFSQPELNQRCTNTAKCGAGSPPWISTLIYRSTATPDAFYMAFEDLPTSAQAFDAVTDTSSGTCSGTFKNDGDFNDFVFFVTGITCAGGGQACDASATDPSLKGACSVGLTDCSTDGLNTVCRPVVKPGPEKCDNVDNDCNGSVDDGMGLCAEGNVCDRGVCVGACGTGEFNCAFGLLCENGFCVDPACKALNCPMGQACRGGVCVGACDGVKCPTNQECQLGRCVDLCAGVTCEGAKVCERGICISNCQCRACADEEACAADGRCVDKGCESKTCETGFVCVNGTCKDSCEGAACPGGAACKAGVCGEPKPGDVPVGGATGTAGGISIGEPPGTSTGGRGGSGSAVGGSSGASSNPTTPRGGAAESGCACRLGAHGSGQSGAAAWVALLGLGLTLLRRRRGAR